MKKQWIGCMFIYLFLICSVSAQETGDIQLSVEMLKQEKDSLILVQDIGNLEKSRNERDLNTLIKYYYAVGNPVKGKNMVAYAEKKFPHGENAFTNASNKIYDENDPAIKAKILARVIQDFPSKEKDGSLDSKKYEVASAYAKVENIPKSSFYLHQIKSPDFRPFALMMVADIVSLYNLNQAASLTKEALRLEKIKAFNSSLDTTKLSYRDSRATYYQYAHSYALLLAKQGYTKEALQYAQEVYDNTISKTSDIVANYASLLAINAKYAIALPLLEKLIFTGSGTPLIKSLFIKSYETINPGKNGSDILTRLYDSLFLKTKTNIAEQMINEPAPSFVVKDLNGHAVSLSDFKGKIIVLDFWATWCIPCKKSFPAMQLTVNHYLTDPNVKFLFIHTWEHSKNTIAEATRYLSDHHYSFDLYMDMKDTLTGLNPAVSNFKVNGIPSKFVIDQNGRIRFKITGSPEGEDTAVQELIAMIDYLKT